MPRRKAKVILSAVAIGVCMVGAYWLRARERSGLPRSDSYCNVEVLAKPTVRDTRFEIVDVSCDTLAKDESVRVYVLIPRRSWFGGSRDEGKLLFSYDPGGPQNSLPQIRAASDEALTTSIPWISSISYKTDQWNGKPILYEIGRIDYP